MDLTVDLADQKPVSQAVYELKLKTSEFTFPIILILVTLSGHKFAHAMTAQLSWHVQNIDLIYS